jgi:hypothetical protein
MARKGASERIRLIRIAGYGKLTAFVVASGLDRVETRDSFIGCSLFA